MSSVTDGEAPRSGADFRLKDWLVQPRRGRLVSGSEERHLEPRTMDLLTLLAGARGEVVSKNEIIDAVWSGRFISEGTVTNAVAELRQALGDDARRPCYIETVPKRGYRLLVPVGGVGPGPPGVPARRRSSRRFVMAAVVALAGAAAVLWLLRPGAPTGDGGVIMVVPLANRTGDASLDPIGAQAAGRLAQGISAAGLGRPVPAEVDGEPLTLAETCDRARAAGAALVLQGAVYLQERGLELQTELVDVSRCAVLYAVPSAVGPRGTSGAVLDTLTQRVLGAVATHRSAHAHSRLLSHVPVFDAYREFLAGSELFAVEPASAVAHLERAVEIDPRFTSAQLRLAIAYANVGRADRAEATLAAMEARRSELNAFELLWLDWGRSRVPRARPAASAAALEQLKRFIPGDAVLAHLEVTALMELNRPRAALAAARGFDARQLAMQFERNPLLATFFYNVATARHMTGDLEGEHRAAEESVALFPGNAYLHAACARALAAMGDADGVRGVISRALSTELRGASRGYVILAAALAADAHGHAPLGESLARRAAAWFEEEGAGPVDGYHLAQAYVAAGRLDAAAGVLAPLAGAGLPGGDLRLLVTGLAGVVAARRGDLALAARLDAQLASAGAFGESSFQRAAIAAWLGRRDDAVALLRKAMAEGWCRYASLHDDNRMLLEPLKGTPSWGEVVQPVR